MLTEKYTVGTSRRTLELRIKKIAMKMLIGFGVVTWKRVLILKPYYYVYHLVPGIYKRSDS